MRCGSGSLQRPHCGAAIAGGTPHKATISSDRGPGLDRYRPDCAKLSHVIARGACDEAIQGSGACTPAHVALGIAAPKPARNDEFPGAEGKTGQMRWPWG
jgi:hypothetical protein